MRSARLPPVIHPSRRASIQKPKPHSIYHRHSSSRLVKGLDGRQDHLASGGSKVDVAATTAVHPGSTLTK